MKEDTLLQHQPGMHAAFVGGSAVQMQDLRPTYVNAQKTPLYNSHHQIDGLPKKRIIAYNGQYYTLCCSFMQNIHSFRSTVETIWQICIH